MKPIYLDNAATSHPKPESVYRAVMDAVRHGGSAGRGSHQQAQSTGRMIFETRELLAELFNAPDSDRFIFTANATLAINQALFGLLNQGDRVVTSSIEHNAVARPLRALQDRGVEVVKVGADNQSAIVDLESIQRACLEKKTRLLVINHCSNVVGSIQPIEELGPWCKQQGILFMVDGSQTAGALPINFQTASIDIFVAPGHKRLLGPQGTGFLYVAEGIDLTPLVYGGTGANSRSELQPEFLPERLESGTLNVPGIAGLHAGLLYLQQKGVDQIRQHDLTLVKLLIDGLQAIAGMTVYGPQQIALRGEVVSFNIEGHDPSDIGYKLDQKNIAVRVGLHCAPDAHRTIGTYPDGTVRVSPGCFTTDEEIDYFLLTVAGIAQSGQ
jgi:cysteine desulfurase / selenocysteine lyase